MSLSKVFLASLILCSECFGAYSLPIKASASNRYLTDQNGTPYYILGDTPQALMAQLSPTQANDYFTNRVYYGFNTVQFHVLCGDLFGEVNGQTYDGITPFTTGSSPADYDISTPRETYFARLDVMLQLAASNSLVCILDPIELINWLACVQNNGTNKMFGYGAYLGNRYENYTNIIWQWGNDFQSWRTTEADRVLIKYGMAGIASQDANHLQTIWLDYPEGSWSTEGWSDWGTWLGLNSVYTYRITYNAMLDAYNDAHYVPTHMTESAYEYEAIVCTAGGTVNVLRRQFYWSLTCGGSGHIYGNYYTWRCSWPADNHLDSPGATNMSYGATFVNTINWSSLVPDQAHTFLTAGYGTFGSDSDCAEDSDYATAALSANGKLGLIYTPTSHTLTVDMSKMASSTRARWFDPSDGTYTAIAGSPFPNTGSRNFTHPGTNHDGDYDWLLLLEAPVPVVNVSGTVRAGSVSVP